MPSQVTITIDGPDLPIGFQGSFNKFLQFLRENWGGNVSLGNTGVLPGQIGGNTPTSNIGIYVNGRNIMVWDDSLAKYVNASDVPIGAYMAWAGPGSNYPENYLLCDGRILQNTDPDNTQLFAVIGTIYGKSGDTGFMLPDCLGRYACGAGTGDYSKNADIPTIGKITTRIIGQIFGFEWPIPQVTRQTSPAAPTKVTKTSGDLVNKALNNFTGTCPPSFVVQWLIRYK